MPPYGVGHLSPSKTKGVQNECVACCDLHEVAVTIKKNAPKRQGVLGGRGETTETHVDVVERMPRHSGGCHMHILVTKYTITIYAFCDILQNFFCPIQQRRFLHMHKICTRAANRRRNPAKYMRLLIIGSRVRVPVSPPR